MKLKTYTTRLRGKEERELLRKVRKKLRKEEIVHKGNLSAKIKKGIKSTLKKRMKKIKLPHIYRKRISIKLRRVE